MLLRAGHAWLTEYGDPYNETDFEYLIKYSPLHNVRVPAGSHQYPAVLLTTGAICPKPAAVLHCAALETASVMFPQSIGAILRQAAALGVYAADHDDRVVPLHSYKFIATLQHVLAGYPDSPQRNPLLIRVDSKAGHGGGVCFNELTDAPVRAVCMCLCQHGTGCHTQKIFACTGKPTGKVIEEYSDVYGFAAKATSSAWILQKPMITAPVNVAG